MVGVVGGDHVRDIRSTLRAVHAKREYPKRRRVLIYDVNLPTSSPGARSGHRIVTPSADPDKVSVGNTLHKGMDDIFRSIGHSDIAAVAQISAGRGPRKRHAQNGTLWLAEVSEKIGTTGTL